MTTAGSTTEHMAVKPLTSQNRTCVYIYIYIYIYMCVCVCARGRCEARLCIPCKAAYVGRERCVYARVMEECACPTPDGSLYPFLHAHNPAPTHPSTHRHCLVVVRQLAAVLALKQLELASTARAPAAGVAGAAARAAAASCSTAAGAACVHGHVLYGDVLEHVPREDLWRAPGMRHGASADMSTFQHEGSSPSSDCSSARHGLDHEVKISRQPQSSRRSPPFPLVYLAPSLAPSVYAHAHTHAHARTCSSSRCSTSISSVSCISVSTFSLTSFYSIV